jgi:hypothetical protein
MGRFLARAKALSRQNETERMAELARLCPDCAPR